MFRAEGFSVQLDPTPNGNCQFEAMAEQLRRIGIYRSITSLRREIVNDLQHRPTKSAGTSLESFVHDNDIQTYLEEMEKSGTYGDNVTLQRASEMYNVQFIVLSSIGPHATQIVLPSGRYSPELQTLVLGHFAEGDGEHHVNLNGPHHGYMEAMEFEEVCESTGNEHAEQETVERPQPSGVPLSTNMCQLPDEMLHVMFSYVLAAGAFYVGLLRSTWSDRQRVGDILSNSTIHVRPNLLTELEGSFNFIKGIRCKCSICKLLPLAGKGSGLALRLRKLFSAFLKWYHASIIVIATELPGVFNVCDFIPSKGW